MASLTIVRRIAARRETVFEALVSPEAILEWWGPDGGPVLLAETDLRVGGGFRVRFRTLDGSEHESAGEYLALDPPRHLAMTWRWTTGGGDDGETRVEISLRETAEGTELTFTHSGFATESARDSHREGWNGALDKLEAIFPEERG